MSNALLIQYRNSLDRIDSAFFHLLSEYAHLPKTSAETKKQSENNHWKDINPALFNLIETLRQDLLSFCSLNLDSNTNHFSSSIEQLKVEMLENQLAELLIYRFKVVTQVGVIKQMEHLPVRDSERWEDLRNNRLQLTKSLGLPTQKIKNYLEKLHEASCIWQELIAKMISEGKEFAEIQTKRL